MVFIHKVHMCICRVHVRSYMYMYVSLGREQIILKLKPKIAWVFITRGECKREIAISHA